MSRRQLDWPDTDIERLARKAVGAFVGAQRIDDRIVPAELSGKDTSATELDRFPPELPRDEDALLRLFSAAGKNAVENRDGRFMAFFPTRGLPAGALAAMLAAGYNRPTGAPDYAPHLVRMEHSLMRWLCDLFALPGGSIGTMTSGTSMSTLIAVAAAADTLPDVASRADATVYVTEQTHHCVVKALRVAGFPATAVREVPMTPDWDMDPKAARAMVAADRAAGRLPFLLVGTAGTTASGAIDPLHELADLADDEDLWFHVDGAYGGFFQLTERGGRRLTGIGRADSIALDPPKTLFLPFGTGVLLVREAAHLHRTFSHRGDYMTDLDDDSLPSYADLGPELSREYRAAQLWLPLHLHGVAAFRETLDDMLNLAEFAHDDLAGDPALDVGPRPRLATVVFRLADGTDDDNRDLLRRINSDGRTHLSGCVVDGRYFLRMTVLNPATYRSEVEGALAGIHDAVRRRVLTHQRGGAA